MELSLFTLTVCIYREQIMGCLKYCLVSLQVLKLYAWEKSFQTKILDIRNKELDILKRYGYLQAFSTFSFTCAPFLVRNLH